VQLLTGQTSVALWHDMVHDAEAKCGILLAQDLEAYLVFLLMRFLKRPDLANQIIALEYLQKMRLSAGKRLLELQEVGDKCLLFSGLFPHLAAKRFVTISYFVNMGQSAYASVSTANHDLFESLAYQFVPLMDVLQTIQAYTKKHPDLLPFEAYDLWNETHSKRALKLLQGYSKTLK
jgi:hypothetical protein